MGKEKTTLRIAMTAHSLVYAPLYRAAQLINKRHDGWVHVELVFAPGSEGPTKGFGDADAYECLQVDPTIDLCLADPMVVATEGWRHVTENTSMPSGRILAVLVQRPALWALTTPSTTPELRKLLRSGRPIDKGSVAHKVQQERNADFATVNLGRLCTYDAGSTAYRVMEFMRRTNYFKWSDHDRREVERLGDEFHYFAPNPKQPVDVVVTCDSYAAYYLKSLRRSDIQVFFSWHLSSLIQDIPFTALIARRDFRNGSWAKKAAVRELLRQIQSVLDREVLNGHDNDEAVVESFLRSGQPVIDSVFLSGVTEARTTLEGSTKELGTPGVGQIEQASGEVRPESRAFAEMLLHKLRQRPRERGVGGIFPSTIRPDAKWVLKAWDYSFRTIWRIGAERFVTDAQVRQCYKACIDCRPARHANPVSIHERCLTAFLRVLDELVGSGDEIARIAVTSGAFLLLLASVVGKSFWPDAFWVAILSTLASPWLFLGTILAIDIFTARSRLRRRLRQDPD